MLANMLKLNRDKTELLVIGQKHKVNPPIKGIYVAGDYIEAASSARNIGVIFDSHVNLEKRVTNTCKMAFYHLRNIARIKNCLSRDDAEILVHAFISSKLDFCNALLYGLPKSVIDRLQYCAKLCGSTGDQNTKLRTHNTNSSETTLATSQTTNYVQNTASYIQSTEWHGAKVYRRPSSSLRPVHTKELAPETRTRNTLPGKYPNQYTRRTRRRS